MKALILLALLVPAAAQDGSQLAKLDPENITVSPTPSQTDQREINEVTEQLTAPIIPAKLAGDYGKWVNVEVAYIITAQERKAFLRLGDDDERDAFIEKFWSKRNRDEHYRRFAYVNEQFGQGAVPGWKTVEGRTYIVLGPPDDTEDHAADHFAIWRYTKIAGLNYEMRIRFATSTR